MKDVGDTRIRPLLDVGFRDLLQLVARKGIADGRPANTDVYTAEELGTIGLEVVNQSIQVVLEFQGKVLRLEARCRARMRACEATMARGTTGMRGCSGAALVLVRLLT